MEFLLYLKPLCLITLLIAVVYRLYRSYSCPRLCYPPGPPRDPIIGNLRHLTGKNQTQTFTEWGHKYGDVVYAQVFGKSLVVLNSVQAARDLLEKRSANYSDRPRFVLLSELMGWNAVLTHMPYGPKFRQYRRLITDRFGPHEIPAYYPVQEKETYTLLQELLASPDHFMQHIRRFAASSILKITYGHTVKSPDDAYVRRAEEVGTATVQSGNPGSTLVDVFPLLKNVPTWMPGAGFKRRALQVRKGVQEMLDIPFQDVKRKMEAGSTLPSFTASLLQQHQDSGKLTEENEEGIKAVAGVLYSAASDTTMCILSTFVLAMILYPGVYRKAQEEIDRVIGQNRLPTFHDRDSLPYLECLLLELYRWNCPVPLAIPHSAVEDDIYHGYHIPKGSMMIPNVWAMSQNAQIYPQPQVFRPERFMGRNGEPDRTHALPTFGFGRRACPGEYLANMSLWMAIANITAAFSLSRSLDSHGKEIIPKPAFVPGFVSHPKPYTCRFSPRSDRIARLVSTSAIELTPTADF